MSYQEEGGVRVQSGPATGPDEGYYERPQGYRGGQSWGRQSQGGPDFVERHIETPETKEFFKTSEFFAFILAVAGVFIASSVVDGFDAPEAWRLITFLTIGYMISRGIAKAGARKGNDRGY